MPKVERHVVKAPNEKLQGLMHTRSAAPGASGPYTRDPNQSLGSGAPGGSGALARSPSPVSVPDHRFKIEDAQMPQPPSAIEPGTGAVPIYPFNSMGLPNPVSREPDSAQSFLAKSK